MNAFDSPDRIAPAPLAAALLLTPGLALAQSGAAAGAVPATTAA